MFNQMSANHSKSQYKLLVNRDQWIDCHPDTESGVLYTAKTLSKYSFCRVEVYNSRDKLIACFSNGHFKKIAS